MTAARFIAGFVACSTLASCSIDDRNLTSADPSGGSPGSAGAVYGDSGGAPEAGKSGVSGANEGGSQATGEAGVGGQAEPSAQPIARVGDCADLDEDGVADCQETLLANPSFKPDVSHWTADAGASLTWDPRDALGASDSGSALLAAESNAFDAGGSSLVTAGQCVQVTGGQIVVAYANAWVDDGQDSTGNAAVNVDFYDASDCTGIVDEQLQHRRKTVGRLPPAAGWTLKGALLTSTATRTRRASCSRSKKPFCGAVVPRPLRQCVASRRSLPIECKAVFSAKFAANIGLRALFAGVFEELCGGAVFDQVAGASTSAGVDEQEGRAVGDALRLL